MLSSRPVRLALLGAAVSLCLAARSAEVATAPLRLPAIPFPLQVENAPVSVRAPGDGSLELTAPKHTNLFNSPDGGFLVRNAPMVLFAPDREFVLTAKVHAELSSVFDVAALVVFENNELWAKLCFENSPARVPMIVSVVTRGRSDDCNAYTLQGSETYLALVRKGSEFSLHASPDGRRWNLIRHFPLEVSDRVRVGFAAHGSGGKDLTAVFSEISYSTTLPRSLRNLTSAQ